MSILSLIISCIFDTGKRGGASETEQVTYMVGEFWLCVSTIRRPIPSRKRKTRCLKQAMYVLVQWNRPSHLLCRIFIERTECYDAKTTILA